MSVYAAIAGIAFVVVGVVLEGISAAITGIQSTKEEGSTRQTLQAAAATIGFGTLFFLGSLTFLFLYQVRSKVKPSRGLAITSIVFGVIAVLLLLTGALIAGILSNQYKEDNPTVYNALRTAAIQVGIGILLIVIGYIILYIVIGRKFKKASKFS